MSVLHCVLIVAALMIMDECSGIILILIQIGSTCNKKYVLQVNIIGKQNNPSIRLYKGLLTITTLSPSTQTPIPLTTHLPLPSQIPLYSARLAQLSPFHRCNAPCHSSNQQFANPPAHQTAIMKQSDSYHIDDE